MRAIYAVDLSIKEMEEMESLQIDIMAINETKRTNSGLCHLVQRNQILLLGHR